MATSAFSWNLGGWLGAQLGGSLWMLILGVVLLWREPVSGAVCLAAFAALNLWGVYLWKSRGKLTAYAGIQRLLMGVCATYLLVVWVVNASGASQPPSPGEWVSTRLPYGLVALGPALMLFFHIMERAARKRDQ